MRRLVYRSSLLALLAVGFTALAAQDASGQELTGTIVGTVADESRGLLPGATVTVVNVDTGVKQSLTTDREGRYRAANLIPGSYEVWAALTGFRDDTAARHPHGNGEDRRGRSAAGPWRAH